MTRGDFNKEAKLVSQGNYKPSVRLKPHINSIMKSAYHVAKDQMRLMEEKSEDGYEMDGQEIRKYAALVEAVSRLERTEREQAKAFDPTQFDTRELLEYAEKAKELLNGTEGSEED